MASTQPVPALDLRVLAHDARSILACPAAVSLVIEGEEHAVGEDDQLRLSDDHGTPTFLCPEGSPVARGAAHRRSALLSITSGLGRHGSPERGDTLTLAGRLEHTGVEHCECCAEVRHVVSLDLNFVLLARPVPDARALRDSDRVPAQRQVRVPLEQFRSAAHHLNRGHLQRSVEHANDCHQEELRQAVSLGTGIRPGDLLGVRIARLSPADVTVQWVDVAGAHQQVIGFPRAARDLTELGEMLRRGLHAGIC